MAGCRLKGSPSFILLGLPVLFLVVFFFYPLLSIFQVSLFPEGGLEVAGFVALFTRPYIREILLWTVWQATLSTLLTFAVGLPAAYVFARFQFRGKTTLRALLTVPFVLPTVVVATAFLALLGPRGLLNSWLQSMLQLETPPVNLQNTMTLILLAHVFYNVSIVIRIVGSFWASLDPHLEEAAAMLGASPRRVFREVTLPLLWPSIGAAALLVFLFTFSSFGVVLILGGLRFATLEVEIYRQTVAFFNLPLAASLSLLQIVFTFTVMTVYTRLQAAAARPLSLRSERSVQRPVRSVRERLVVVAALALPVVLVFAPVFALVERSVTVGEGVSLQYYLTLGANPRRSVLAVAPFLAIRNSIGFALATMTVSLLLGVLGSYLLSPPRGRRVSIWRSLLDPIFLLPLGTSAVTLGLGYLIALDEPPLNLRTSVVLIPLAHSLIAFPFVVRSLLPVLRSIQPAIREAAAVLGARPWRVLWEVDLPILWRALVVASTFAFAISIGEFGATSLLSRPEWPTMPVVIYRFLGQPGVDNYGRALAMSVILMSTTVSGFILIERFRVGELGEF